MQSACDIFYGIYNEGGRSDIIKDLVKKLDFHALSITLLATTASHNMWDYDRLAKEWETRREQVLRTDHNESLAATIELSLSSQTFLKLSLSPSSPLTSRKRFASSIFHKLIPSPRSKKLSLSARELLEVVAFFPQGISENNLDWLFPTISDRRNILDKFCLLSLTYRRNGFINMLAPIRDYLSPKDPKSSPLLCATKGYYLDRLSIEISPSKPRFEEARWIASEDVNVEHLLDVFMSTDPTASDIWVACHHFMEHLYWHKPRQTVLRSKIEALSDDHPSKPQCLSRLSWLCARVGNRKEQKRLLTHALTLDRGRGDERRVFETLRYLSDVNRILGLHEEGIQRAKEAFEISERLGDRVGQAKCLSDLAWLLFADEQLSAAEDAASRTFHLVPEKGHEYFICQSRRLLGKIHQSKGEKEKAIHHFKAALDIASPFNWRDELFWIHHDLAWLFADEDELDDANAYIQRAKSHAVDNTFYMAQAMEEQARVWYRQGRFEEATSEALCALKLYEKLGVAADVRVCKGLLQVIERAMRSYPASIDPDRNGELLEMMLCPTPIKTLSLARGASHPAP